MLWNGRELKVKATLISARDHGNLTFEVAGRQVSVPHLALIDQDAIDKARTEGLVLDTDWLEAQCPLAKTMTLKATVVSVRDLSNAVVLLGVSKEARQVTLDQRVIAEAAGIEDEPLGAAAQAP